MTDSITVQVALRIRPLIEIERLRGCQNVLESIPSENHVQVRGTDKSFAYNYVFDEHIPQSEFYERAVKKLVTNLFKGYNVTILAYGQTGSGKTHSMGTTYDGSGEMGVIPRAILDIFTYIEKNSEKYDFRVSCSFMELYQENLYDLLSNKPREQNVIDIREDAKGIKMPGLTEKLVGSVEDTTNCLINGSMGRATGATAMNAYSSRSHAIFTITVYMANKNDEDNATTAKFHLVDLAGSERSKKTKATGERFKEGININKGLLALGNVISALGEETQKGYISYRDSKLTRLLQDSLGGNSMTLMIACVSPADYNLEETISTLRYADRARKIKNKPIINQDPKAAEIARLNIVINQLKVQLLGEGGVHVSSDELDKLKEDNQRLIIKNRQLNKALAEALASNTAVFERQLLTEAANERMKRKLNELQETCNVTLNNMSNADDCSPNLILQIEKLTAMKNLIQDMHVEQEKTHEEILTHETQTRTPNCNTNHINEHDLDEQQESHTKEQLNRNMELHELNKELALKEQLALQIISNNNHIIDYVSLSQNENKIANLEKEKNELLQQLKDVRTTDAYSKLSEQRRRRVKELETQITELNRKVVEQARLIKMKEKDDQKIKQLNNEIQSMKANKVKLIKSMRVEEQKFRAWKMQKEKDLMKLKDQDRKRQNQIIKMENIHQKQQIVMKRKVEEAIAVNKRLKDALMLQKIAQDRRKGIGTTEKMHQWVSQELEVMVSTIQAERSLEQLIDLRTLLNEQLEQYKHDQEFADTVEGKEKIKKLISDIDMRSTQIADLQQKIIDSDQENKSKTRWDMVQSMVDAKTALKQLFELAADIRRKSLNNEYQLEELTTAHNEALVKLCDQEKLLKEQSRLHEQNVAHILKENEEKVFVLLKQLRGINVSSTNQTLTERLKIQEQALDKMEALEKELDEYKQKMNELQNKMLHVSVLSQKEKLSGKPKKTKVVDVTFIKNDESNIEGSDISMIDDTKDLDWHNTPIFKRVIANRSKIIKSENDNNANRTTVKRSSDGKTKCNCKTLCKSRICGCKKVDSFCTDLCKCTNCTNHENQNERPKPLRFDDTDSDDSFKRPKFFLLENNSEQTPRMKYKKSYFKTENDGNS